MRLPGSFGALSEPRFRLLFAGQAGSALGSSLVPVALAFAVLDVSGSPTALGLVLAASRVPQVVFALAGGIAGDRFARQRVMLAADLVRLATQGATAALLLSGHARIWQLVVLQAAHGTAAAFFNPAATALVPQTVGPDRLQQANALLGMTRSAAAILGQPAAGLLVALAGPGVAFAVDSGSYAVSAVALALLRVPSVRATGAATSLLREAREGFAEFRARRWLWVSSLHVALLNGIAAGPFFVLGPVVAERSLGGAGAWGGIVAAFAAGTLLGGGAALRLRPRHPLAAAFGAVFLIVPNLALLAAAAPLPAVLVGAALAGAQASFFNTIWVTTLQAHVPAGAVARVDACCAIGMLVLAPVGMALAGPAAALVGVSTVFWAGAVWAAGSTAVVLAAGGVRRVGRAAPEAALAVA